ncbi:hypothetical protein M885DRAFT_326712 [Pelagophyceae sp. CCMP2097]|nr:hypothetical protein M885DRAFT_326712 [Pelagophyceae sp. CCMP2097]
MVRTHVGASNRPCHPSGRRRFRPPPKEPCRGSRRARFERYAAVCVYFDLQRPFHALLDHLLQHRPVQALSGFEDEASEADARQVSAVRLGLKLAVQGADLCREAGWARVVDLLLDVGDSRMLPATWTRIDDICSEDGRTLAPSSFAHRCKAHWTRAAVSNTAPPRLDEIAHKGAALGFGSYVLNRACQNAGQLKNACASNKGRNGPLKKSGR